MLDVVSFAIAAMVVTVADMIFVVVEFEFDESDMVVIELLFADDVDEIVFVVIGDDDDAIRKVVAFVDETVVVAFVVVAFVAAVVVVVDSDDIVSGVGARVIAVTDAENVTSNSALQPGRSSVATDTVILNGVVEALRNNVIESRYAYSV